jgi:CubicO group peptidase (beta-lactamase class C family)
MRYAWLASVCLVFIAAPPVHGAVLGADAHAIDAALESGDAGQREAALDRLIATGDSRAELQAQLAQLLGDADLAVAGKAAKALGLRGAAAFRALEAVLKSGSDQQRWGATVALAQTGADIEGFVPTLTRQLSDRNELIVRASLAALTRLQAKAAPAVPGLRSLLSHPEAEIRWAAIETLGAVGPPAREAVPSNEPFLRDEAVELRLMAVVALQRIAPPSPISKEALEGRIAWLRENVPALMTHLHVPGVSIAIVQHGEVTWAQGFGVRDPRDGTPVTAETIFEAASLSKPILSLVALQMVQDGRLDLDRPLVQYLGHDYLPDYPDHRLITARMVLTQRSGLPNWRMGYADMGGPLPLQFPPGSEYTYSGEGIFFLQQALETAARASLQDLAQAGLIEPLRLEHTSFVWSEAIERNLASGHRADGSFKERTRYRHANGAYSLYTTPSDYARLMLTLMTPTMLGDRAFTPASIALMLQPELRIEDDPVPRPGRSRAVATYRALGWKLHPTPDGTIVWHSGSNSSGFKTFAQFNPAKQSGLVIFANGDSGYDLRETVVKQIGDL